MLYVPVQATNTGYIMDLYACELDLDHELFLLSTDVMHSLLDMAGICPRCREEVALLVGQFLPELAIPWDGGPLPERYQRVVIIPNEFLGVVIEWLEDVHSIKLYDPLEYERERTQNTPSFSKRSSLPR